MPTKTKEFACDYQDCSSHKFDGTGLPCALVFKTELSFNYHVRERHDSKHVFLLPAELAVKAALKHTFGDSVQHDWDNLLPLEACENWQPENKSYRFDLRTPAPEGCEMLLLTEVDERQHKRYPCDLKRMLHSKNVLTLEFPSVPIVFVRFNPDARKIGDIHFSPPLAQRIDILVKVLKNEPVFDNKRLSELVRHEFNVVYLFYDLEAGGPLSTRVRMLNNVTDVNAENAEIVRAHVIAAI